MVGPLNLCVLSAACCCWDAPFNIILGMGKQNYTCLTASSCGCVFNRRPVLHGDTLLLVWRGSRIGQLLLTAPSTHKSYPQNYYHQVSGEWRLCRRCCCYRCCCCARCGGGERASLSARRSSGLPCLPASIDTATSKDYPLWRPRSSTHQTHSSLLNLGFFFFFCFLFFQTSPRLPSSSSSSSFCACVCQAGITPPHTPPPLSPRPCVGSLDDAQVNDTAHLLDKNDLMRGDNWF